MVRHCVLVEEQWVVEVDVTIVWQAVEQDVVDVVKHCVDVDDIHVVEVEVTIVVYAPTSPIKAI